MNAQFPTSVSQAAALFGDLQSSVAAPHEHQQALQQTAVASFSTLQDQNAELMRLRQAQSTCEEAAGQGRQHLSAMSTATEQQAQAVGGLRIEVQQCFPRTADVIYQHEDRIRPQAAAPVLLTESPSNHWRPAPNASLPRETHPVLDSTPESPDPCPSVPSNHAFPPPRVAHPREHRESISFEERQVGISDALAGNNRNTSAPSYTNFKLSPSRVFNSERYGV